MSIPDIRGKSHPRATEYKEVLCKTLIVPLYICFIATQMWCLGRFFPLMIGHFVPEENSNWSHFLQLLDIMELVFASRVHPDMPPYLQFLIAENLEKFKVLYPTSSFKPKMHYLTHIPRYLER